MQRIESLITHLEKLDEQLASSPAFPEVGDGKLVKEVLVTRLELRRYFQHHSHVVEGTPLAGRLARLRNGSVYNIDRLYERYAGSISCPACRMTDVALIKKIPVGNDVSYDLHNNPRLRLMIHDPAPASGNFVCNSCLTRFTPPLSSHHVRLCEMLFAYYN